jgi:hypothetical protein
MPDGKRERKRKQDGVCGRMPRVGYVHSPETREKMSANHADLSGSNHPMFGKHHTPEACKKIGNIHSGNTYRRGSKHTPESIEKMRLAKLGKPRPMSQAVYDGLRRAAERRKGTTLSEEQKVKISETIHAKLPEYKDKLIEAWADPLK